MIAAHPLREGNGTNALVEALEMRLPEASVGGASAGLHLIAWLLDGVDETATADATASRGVGDPHAA